MLRFFKVQPNSNNKPRATATDWARGGLHIPSTAVAECSKQSIPCHCVGSVLCQFSELLASPKYTSENMISLQVLSLHHTKLAMLGRVP